MLSTQTLEHDWKKDQCTRCGVERRRPETGGSLFRYYGGTALVGGRRLLHGIGTWAQEHQVVCVSQVGS